MKISLAVLFTLALAAVPLGAQTMTVGASVGASNEVNDGLNLHLNDRTRELWVGTELEPSTLFGFKVGQVDSDNGPAGAENGKVEYIDALVEYRFSEVFGSTGLFAGPGYYRQKFGRDEESNYGIAAGVNGIFPVTRRFGFTAELAYHWVNFDQSSRFLTATGGVRVGF